MLEPTPPTATSPAIPTTSVAPSLWTPLLEVTAFRFIWLALLAENICSWLMDVANGWVMTMLSPSPLMVSLVQTAATLPVLLLALPAGALADIFQRRSILLFVQLGLFACGAVLAGLSHLQWLTPEFLLVLIFINGVFLALGMPAWQALIPEVVQGPLQGSSLLLGGVAVNVSRAIGPALAGVLLAVSGPTAAFVVNALGCIFVWYALHRWAGPVLAVTASALPAERVLSATWAGMRYAANDVNLRRVAIRFICLALPASALWGMLPLVARITLSMNSVEYGFMMAGFGTGAVVGAWLMNRYIANANINIVIAVNTFILAVCVASLSLLTSKGLSYPLMFCVGVVWMALSGCFTMSVQSTVPGWVRGRALSLTSIALQGSMAVGGLVWGLTAQHFGVDITMSCAAVLMLAGLACSWRLTLTKGVASQNFAFGLLPALAAPDDVNINRTPMVVQQEFRVALAESAVFVALMQSIGVVRRKNGATAWQLLESSSEPGLWVESFAAASYIDHERQRARLTIADQALIASAYAMHQGGGAHPLMTRWFGAAEVTV
jgi:MFS family permease